MKVCSNCDSVFENDSILTNSGCPIKGCAGDILDIDENFYEAYKLLNDKGYFTEACCSGHVCEVFKHAGAYILFQERHDFLSLPQGFKVDTYGDKEDLRTSVRKSFDEKLSSIELQKQLWNTARDVLEWAERLECVDSEESEDDK